MSLHHLPPPLPTKYLHHLYAPFVDDLLDLLFVQGAHTNERLRTRNHTVQFRCDWTEPDWNVVLEFNRDMKHSSRMLDTMGYYLIDIITQPTVAGGLPVALLMRRVMDSSNVFPTVDTVPSWGGLVFGWMRYLAQDNVRIRPSLRYEAVAPFQEACLIVVKCDPECASAISLCSTKIPEWLFTKGYLNDFSTSAWCNSNKFAKFLGGPGRYTNASCAPSASLERSSTAGTYTLKFSNVRFSTMPGLELTCDFNKDSLPGHCQCAKCHPLPGDEEYMIENETRASSTLTGKRPARAAKTQGIQKLSILAATTSYVPLDTKGAVRKNARRKSTGDAHILIESDDIDGSSNIPDA